MLILGAGLARTTGAGCAREISGGAASRPGLVGHPPFVVSATPFLRLPTLSKGRLGLLAPSSPGPLTYKKPLIPAHDVLPTSPSPAATAAPLRPSPPAMIDVDRNLLHSSLPHRIDFARRFIQFSDDDAEVLNAAAPLVAPLVQGVVDGVYCASSASLAAALSHHSPLTLPPLLPSSLQPTCSTSRTPSSPSCLPTPASSAYAAPPSAFAPLPAQSR